MRALARREARKVRMPKAKIKRLYLIPILSKALDVIELFERDHLSTSRRRACIGF